MRRIIMPFALNGAPNFLLDTILNYDKTLNFEVDDIITKPTFSSWPNNIKVVQDQPIKFYVRALAKLLLNAGEINLEDGARLSLILKWQARQAYRIINAAISSIRVDDKLKYDLCIARNLLESHEEIKSLLDEIAQNQIKPDIVCSGHAIASLESGYVKNIAENDVEIVLHSGVGSTLEDGLGILIENQLSHQYDINIFNKLNLTVSPDDRSTFPKVITPESLECIPNFNFQGRIIEFETGRILKVYNLTNLQQIINDFPGRRIHWAGCSTVYQNINDRRKNLGPYHDTRWEAENKKSNVKPQYYLRFYQSVQSMDDYRMAPTNENSSAVKRSY